MTTAAIAATFADFKTVKTRSTAQFIFELPIEQADAALKLLGGIPIPGKEPWVGIAPLDLTKPKAPPAADAKPKERRPFHSLPRASQAILRCKDARFQAWLDDGYGVVGEVTAADIVRTRCGVASRAALDTDQEAGKRWDALNDRYLRETGQQTERRG